MGSPPQPARVLIVDDDEPVLIALQMAFEETNWRIEVVTLARLALERHRADPAKLLIVDKNLPDMDGVELVREVRRADTDVAIIMITGYGSIESAIETANLGIDAYLEKPFPNVFDLLTIASKVLERRRPTAATRLGVTFARPDTQQRIPAREPLDSSCSDASDSPPSPPLRANTALIACAVPDARTLLESCARKHKLDAVHAPLTGELLQLLLAWTPSVVIIYGAMDVADLVQRIRDRSPDVPVAVIADSLDVATARQLIALQVGAIVNEPLGSRQFDDRIKKIARSVRVAR